MTRRTGFEKVSAAALSRCLMVGWAWVENHKTVDQLTLLRALRSEDSDIHTLATHVLMLIELRRREEAAFVKSGGEKDA